MQKQNLDSKTARREAGLSQNFQWQDEAAEGHFDGTPEVDYATVLGTLPEKVHGSPVFLVHVHGMATSTFGYSYSVEETVTVHLMLKDEDELVPVTSVATGEELAAYEKAMEEEENS